MSGVDRTIEVAPERLAGWVERYELAHGRSSVRSEGRDLVLTSPDAGTARLVDRWGHSSGTPVVDDLDAWIADAARPRTVGVLLVRRAAHAVGVAQGDELVAHHVETHYVQGRTKAGGWSQQRYARRRANQADHAFDAAADDLVRVVLPYLGDIEFLVCGGDRGAVDAVLADARMAALAGRRSAHGLLQVPDPRLAVLQEAVTAMRRVPVQVTDPPVGCVTGS